MQVEEQKRRAELLRLQPSHKEQRTFGCCSDRWMLHAAGEGVEESWDHSLPTGNRSMCMRH